MEITIFRRNQLYIWYYDCGGQTCRQRHLHQTAKSITWVLCCSFAHVVLHSCSANVSHEREVNNDKTHWVGVAAQKVLCCLTLCPRRAEKFETLDAKQVSGVAQHVVYGIDNPVSIPAKGSAVVPIASLPILGDRVLVYDPKVGRFFLCLLNELDRWMMYVPSVPFICITTQKRCWLQGWCRFMREAAL